VAPTDNIEQVAEGLLNNPQPVEDAEIVDETPPETDEAPDDDQTDAVEDGEATEDADDAEEAETADAEADEEQAENKETDDAAQDGPAITFKVNGEERTATVEEAKQALSGHAYVQQRMQENADMRKQLEQHFQTLQSERNQLAEMAQQVQQGGLQPPQMPSKELLQTDPIAYWEARAQYDEDVAEYQGKMQQVQQVQAQQQQAEAQMRQKYLAEQLQTLQQRDPDFADPKKAEQVQGAILKTAKETYGFTDEELGGIVDARHVQVLNDARKWRELQASKETVSEKAKQARPMKPAARKGDSNKAKAKRTAERMRKTGSIDDVANFLLTGN
jgi:hypothetical protein